MLRNRFSFPTVFLVLICLVSFSLMLWASLGDAAITDELAHIPAGYGYVHSLDYRLNPEHPPLVKALAMLPVLFLNPIFPAGDSSWKTDINGQWDMGKKFLYESGNDANQIIRLARIGPMLLTILLVILIYFWSAELLGAGWALVPAFLFGLSPTVLAHGHYVTTDVGAAFGVAFATYFFLKFLFSPSRKHLVWAGIAFGIAALAKFSTVLLIPYFLILIFFFFLAGVVRNWNETAPELRFKRFGIRAWRYFRSVVFIFAIGYVLIVYPVYFLFTLNYPQEKQTSDTQSILVSFASGPTPAGHFCKPVRCIADADIWMAEYRATRPFAEYLLGVLMVAQRATGGNTNYFLGEVSATGSRLYFPIVYLLKESLPALIFIFIALLLGIGAIVRRFAAEGKKAVRYFFKDYLGVNFAEFSLLVFVLFYWAYSMKSTLNIGVRHLLPTIPFIYMLAAGMWKRWLTPPHFQKSGFALVLAWLKSIPKLLLKYIFFAAIFFWCLAETAFATPHFLSYFNEFGGGIMDGYRFVTDSNYDWGQDLLRLRDFVAQHPEIDKIAVDYFGGGNPKYYLGQKEIDWQSSKGDPSTQRIHWLAVSVNTLQGAIQPATPDLHRKPEDEYQWLVFLRPRSANWRTGMGNLPEPDFRAGTSIFIYKL